MAWLALLAVWGILLAGWGVLMLGLTGQPFEDASHRRRSGEPSSDHGSPTGDADQPGSI